MGLNKVDGVYKTYKEVIDDTTSDHEDKVNKLKKSRMLLKKEIGKERLKYSITIHLDST